ncbi:hypothetical protein A1O3_09161 [Capronia epimyces CBS 606.96]|uniref:Histone H1 n=1 Tax=Capronia epimyces CBS 606.96 TaxID=1182542 RepID=W9XBZ5_9EURO|nr:uncharacterized protein A1O3_09161 [Capronia epimyces CBS 606.96]EXJ78002.1 hypothetical protein A1O3_09161 [Capronia epimyces CBS 606.96]
MPPKKAAASGKEVKDKKPAAAPAHASYKGRYDQGGYPERKPISFATPVVPVVCSCRPHGPGHVNTLVAFVHHAMYHNKYKFIYLLTLSDIQLKERNGSSRQAIKKYVKANNNITVTSETQFDSLFNKALKSGVEKGDFQQPKGPSGPVKLAKKEAKPAEKKPAAPKKEKAAKDAKPKATKTKAAPKVKAASAASKTKKAAAPKKAAAAKPKANTATKRAPKTKTKTDASAPAVQDVPPVLKKTKSGRVTKQKGPAPSKTPAKKATGTKKTATKKATPKKAEAAA